MHTGGCVSRRAAKALSVCWILIYLVFLLGYGAQAASILPLGVGMQTEPRMEDHACTGSGEETQKKTAFTGRERAGTEEFWMGDAGKLRRPWGATGENTRMGNAEALRRFKTGASVLALNYPVEHDFGIDIRSWTVASKFKGLKMVQSLCMYVCVCLCECTGRLPAFTSPGSGRATPAHVGCRAWHDPGHVVPREASTGASVWALGFRVYG
jgi:hypothetical protein